MPKHKGEGRGGEEELAHVWPDPPVDERRAAAGTLPNKVYLKELATLQIELVKLQEWVRHEGLRAVIIFEGRDAAGKGGAIKTIMLRLNPRYARVAALGTPSDHERSQWYFQRYVAHLPAAGELVLFDRSWYNRAGVERVMGFCSEDEYREFLRSCPEFERILVQGEGRHVLRDRYPRGSLVGRQWRRQEARAAQRDPPSSEPDPLPGLDAARVRAAATGAG